MSEPIYVIGEVEVETEVEDKEEAEETEPVNIDTSTQCDEDQGPLSIEALSKMEKLLFHYTGFENEEHFLMVFGIIWYGAKHVWGSV